MILTSGEIEAEGPYPNGFLLTWTLVSGHRLVAVFNPTDGKLYGPLVVSYDADSPASEPPGRPGAMTSRNQRAYRR
jgi:hypothetical protein